jgi:hypothetical protein
MVCVEVRWGGYRGGREGGGHDGDTSLSEDDR